MTKQNEKDEDQQYRVFGKSLESVLKKIPLKQWEVRGNRKDGSISTVVNGVRMRITNKTDCHQDIYNDTVTTVDYNLTIVDGKARSKLNLVNDSDSPLYFIIRLYAGIHEEYIDFQRAKEVQDDERKRRLQAKNIQRLTNKIKKW